MSKRSDRPESFLIIQPAFPGDVILATSLAETLHREYPAASVDMVVRNGNQSLFSGHPFIKNVFIWKKNEGIRGLSNLIKSIRKVRYDYVINVQRHFRSGLITLLSGGKYTVGFSKNPLSFAFSASAKHNIDPNNGQHEIQRNHLLIEQICRDSPAKPALYPADSDFNAIQPLIVKPFICVAPASVWHTKQFPENQWADFINKIPQAYKVYLIGGPDDHATANKIISGVENRTIENQCGKLSFLQSAALMKNAAMNYVNDSAPLHLASAVDAPVTAVFCSTVPGFGFGPLSSEKHIIETPQTLTCRPCGLHGKKACPEGHFRCATTISPEQLLETLP